MAIRRIGQIFVDLGFVDEDQLEMLLEEQQTNRPNELLGQIADNHWLALFDHDSEFAAARLVRDPRRDFAAAEPVAEL